MKIKTAKKNKKIILKKLLPVNVRVNFQGRNIYMKPITAKEINNKYLSWLNDPKLNRYLEIRHKRQKKEDIVEYINLLRAKKGCEVFAIFSQMDNEHIGNCAISGFNFSDGCADYGLLIGNHQAQNHGFGAEATILLMEYFFTHTPVRKVVAGAIADNHRSWKLLEHLGFLREGTLRKQHRLSFGQLADGYLYGILRSEWLKKRKQFMAILLNFKIDKK